MNLQVINKNRFVLLRIEGQEESKPEEFMVSFKRMYEQMDEVMRKEDVTTILFDLTDCNYVNSSMISLFVLATIETREKKGSVQLIVPNENTRQILELVGLHRITTIFKTKAECKLLMETNT